MDPNEMTPAKKLTLSELLMRSLDEEQLEELRAPETERERWDDDEGSSGG